MYVVKSVTNEGNIISEIWVNEGFSNINKGDIYEHQDQGPCEVLRIEKQDGFEVLIVLQPHNKQ